MYRTSRQPTLEKSVSGYTKYFNQSEAGSLRIEWAINVFMNVILVWLSLPKYLCLASLSKDLLARPTACAAIWWSDSSTTALQSAHNVSFPLWRFLSLKFVQIEFITSHVTCGQSWARKTEHRTVGQTATVTWRLPCSLAQSPGSSPSHNCGYLMLIGNLFYSGFVAER